ncbi:MAG: FKBP-type peptidyl-prolyl cis-trans isomerase [Salinivirgaceae bacterium]|nr:FKBP-type peptidyl-prolyl cis-trans isomerase [Salinivirgaceae bacterium]
MKIENGKMVSVTYELKYDDADAKLIEVCEKDHPLTFLFGAGMMLPHFEKNLDGLECGSLFDFVLTADQAYGQVTEEAIVDVPINVFQDESGKVNKELITVGNTIPMMDAHGNRLHGVVVSSTAEAVKMDFNHPLAGADLHFKGKVIEVRNPTMAELERNCGGGCGGGCNCGDKGKEGGCSGCC